MTDQKPASCTSEALAELKSRNAMSDANADGERLGRILRAREEGRTMERTARVRKEISAEVEGRERPHGMTPAMREGHGVFYQHAQTGKLYRDAPLTVGETATLDGGPAGPPATG